MAEQELVPTSDSTNQFTKTGCVSAYQCVDEGSDSISTSDRLSSLSTGQVEHYLWEDTDGLSGVTINSVTIYANCRRFGNAQLKPFFYSGATHYGTTITPGSSYANHSYTWNTNPNTTNAWTVSEVDGFRGGFESVMSGRSSTAIAAIWLIIDYTPAGYSHSVMGVAGASISTVKGVATANISEVMGV